MNNTKVIIYGRLSYPHIFEPDEKFGKYQCSIIIDPSDKAQMQRIAFAIEAAKEAGKMKLSSNGIVPKNIKTPLRNADEEGKDAPELRGMYWLNATSKNRKPQIVDQHRQPILDRDDVYAGCYVNVSINFYAFNTNGNKGISAGLGNIQLVKDGPRLDGGANAEDEFSVIETESSDFLGL